MGARIALGREEEKEGPGEKVVSILGLVMAS